MKLLFIHQNLPGQFRRIAPRLAQDPDNRIVTLGERKGDKRFGGPAIHDYWYSPPKKVKHQGHPWLQGLEAHTLRGQIVYRALMTLRERGEEPDIIVAHPGWGEGLFIRDAFPDTKLLTFCEYYFRSKGGDFDFEPPNPPEEFGALRLRMKNAVQLVALEASDHCIAPTKWQKSRYPEDYQRRMSCIHEGVDTKVVRPNANAAVSVGEDGPKLRRGDEVLTYVARNLEPYRGFHVFMRALPEILKRRPNCQVLIIGGDQVSYGRKLKDGKTYRQRLVEEVGLDSDRVHFIGYVPYEAYLAALQVSAVHVYLTYPFVLSWSCLEAMAVGCAVVGSDTAPVREVIRDGENGFLTDFHDPDALARIVAEKLAMRRKLDAVRTEARRTIVEQFDFETVCFPQYVEMLRSLL